MWTMKTLLNDAILINSYTQIHYGNRQNSRYSDYIRMDYNYQLLVAVAEAAVVEQVAVEGLK